MSSFFGSGPLPDWKELQRLLGRDIPWKLVKEWEKTRNGGWMEDYLKKLLHRSRPPLRTDTRTFAVAETAKNARQVTVSVKLPPETDFRSLRLFASSDRVKVTGLPHDGKKTVFLPCPVLPKTGNAVLKNDRLFVRFRRRRPSRGEVELFIRS